MDRRTFYRRLSVAAGLLLICTITPSPTPMATQLPGGGAPGDYSVIGWNDLGMHCMGDDFSSLVILPPANTLWAQVIKRGNPPVLVEDETVELRYRFIGNSTSADKVNFWQYAQAAFGLASPLPVDVGLGGKAMTGTLDWTAGPGVWEALWIPVTPFEDAAPTEVRPYQLAEITLHDTATEAVLDQTVCVAPVSTEMRCDKCHPTDDDPEEGGGLPVYDSILALHDHEEGTDLLGSRPVLCASCHADAALGAPGVQGIPNLSRAIHKKHAEDEDELRAIQCYDCHPGPNTQCQRGAMFLAGYECIDCHGTMQQMAQDLRDGRQPWLEEPKCATCHPDHSEDEDGTDNLYRLSTGHGGLYCSACHGSPHAILPTNRAGDGLQAIRLQGEAKSLGNCMVCHSQPPEGPGPHGLTYRDAADPAWLGGMP